MSKQVVIDSVMVRELSV